ncbi:hypothetical protein [Labedaea rhizosphaerae]|uniref:Uncharacterized protein n=1 Tax=Labedaea rhizosphaerae TaxID=598644 RepID=A0A4R6SDB4_LABRH|nr:hypothetical protein [Labedaea rhizosphaerae]TDP97096.1 hypothetical protein EV186_10356 [Labedaea rhizosphaerae]
MTGNDTVRRVLERGFGTEPPVGLDRDDLIARGKRRLRRQRAAAISGVALAAVAVLTVTSMTTSWFTGSPTGSAPAASRPTTTTTLATKPSSPKQRLGEALRTAPITWPDEITARTGNPGPHWYDFRYGYLPSADSTGYEANMKLDTPKGYRWLTIDVLGVPAGTHAPECVGAQSKKPLPDCFRTRFPDGTELRVDAETPADASYPTIVLVTVVRPDHTQVDVMETSSVGNGARSSQVMPTQVLIQLAKLPGFAMG